MRLDTWTGKFECVAKRPLTPSDESWQDCLYTFKNMDGDGVIMQQVEGIDFCDVGDKINVSMTKVKEPK
jgi:hypothetical protein